MKAYIHNRIDRFWTVADSDITDRDDTIAFMETEADARLIAAAPELLEALQYFLDYGFDRETASEAVAKAAGEQPT